jgi:hypothetical protein
MSVVVERATSVAEQGPGTGVGAAVLAAGEIAAGDAGGAVGRAWFRARAVAGPLGTAVAAPRSVDVAEAWVVPAVPVGVAVLSGGGLA